MTRRLSKCAFASVRCGRNYVSVCLHYFNLLVLSTDCFCFSVCHLLRDFGYILEIFFIISLNIDLLRLLDSAEFINVLQPYSFSNYPRNRNRDIYYLYSFLFSLFSIAAEFHHLKSLLFSTSSSSVSHKTPCLCSEVLALAAKFLLFNSEIICVDIYKYLLLKWSLF